MTAHCCGMTVRSRLEGLLREPRSARRAVPLEQHGALRGYVCARCRHPGCLRRRRCAAKPAHTPRTSGSCQKAWQPARQNHLTGLPTASQQTTLARCRLTGRPQRSVTLLRSRAASLRQADRLSWWWSEVQGDPWIVLLTTAKASHSVCGSNESCDGCTQVAMWRHQALCRSRFPLQLITANDVRLFSVCLQSR